MTWLIAGGQGFVGLNIAEQCLNEGGQVVLMGPSSAPVAFLDHLYRLPGKLYLLQGDVASAQDIEQAFQTFKPDCVINAAAITAGPAREVTAARDIVTVNLLGTIELLEACLRHRTRRMLQLGTGSIFGQAGQWSDWLDEQTSAAFPDSLYGISKFAAERTCVRYASLRGVDVSVLRLGTVFGRWEYETGARDNQSIPLQLLKAARRGEHSVVFNQCADDWVYSVDVARGVCAAARAPSLEPVYHMSAGMRWDIRDWCDRLTQQFPGFRCTISDDPSNCTVGRSASPQRSPMRIDRIVRDTGYEPAYLAQTAFEDFVQWGSSFLP